MGLDYGLELSTRLTAAQALRLLSEKLCLDWGDPDHLRGPALVVSALEATRPGQDIIEEAFHFKPDLLVMFRLDSNSDGYEEGTRLMLRATLLLLEQEGDGVLLFNGERIILQRLAGQLVLNAEYGNWTEGLRLEDEIRPPHDRRPLPSPLL